MSSKIQVNSALFIYTKLQSVKSQMFTHAQNMYRHIYIHRPANADTCILILTAVARKMVEETDKAE